MYEFDSFLNAISSPIQREKLTALFTWIDSTYPQMKRVIKWNQPMYLDHGTFILGFSVAKNHISVTPEGAGIAHFKDRIASLGYEQSMMLFQIRNDQEIPYDLLQEMIEYNLIEKADIKSFWR